MTTLPTATARWLPMPAACEYLGVSRETLRKYIKLGVIYAERLPSAVPGKGHWRVDRESIDNYLNRGRAKAVDFLRGISA